jgi:hypothetical protein
MDELNFSGRPCYILHDETYPVEECDGVHGVEAITAFYAVEDAAVLGSLRRRIYGKDER